jgi:hypothetical protein
MRAVEARNRDKSRFLKVIRLPIQNEQLAGQIRRYHAARELVARGPACRGVLTGALASLLHWGGWATLKLRIARAGAREWDLRWPFGKKTRENCGDEADD